MPLVMMGRRHGTSCSDNTHHQTRMIKWDFTWASPQHTSPTAHVECAHHKHSNGNLKHQHSTCFFDIFETVRLEDSCARHGGCNAARRCRRKTTKSDGHGTDVDWLVRLSTHWVSLICRCGEWETIVANETRAAIEQPRTWGLGCLNTLSGI